MASYLATVLADSPVTYYRMDDLTTTAVDLMGAVSGTYSGTYTQGVVPGGITSDTSSPAVSFTSGKMSLTTNPLAVGSISIEMWFKTSAATATLLDFRPTVGNNRAIVIRWVTSVMSVFMGNGTVNPSVTPTGTWNDGQWHHLVTTYDGSTIRVYIDAGFRGQTALAGPISYGSSPFTDQLANDAVARALVGSMDEVAFYNTALSATQINLHYIAGITPPPASDPPLPPASIF